MKINCTQCGLLKEIERHPEMTGLTFDEKICPLYDKTNRAFKLNNDCYKALAILLDRKVIALKSYK